jgi:hypothetical protein
VLRVSRTLSLSPGCAAGGYVAEPDEGTVTVNRGLQRSPYCDTPAGRG